MPRKTTDPRKVKLLDLLSRLQAESERWWRRCRRAVSELEKRRQAIRRAEKRLAALEQPHPPAPAA
jgi:hypothetical protein